MYTVEETDIAKRGKNLFIILATFRYLIGLGMAYWGSKIFSTLGYYYRQGLGDNTSGIDCLQCPNLLKDSAIVLIIFGIILLAFFFLDKARDYIPAGIIWILSGIYYLLPSLQAYRRIILGIYIILFIWWAIERAKDSGKLLGYIQIFMPLSLAGVIFSSDISVWLFTIFISISFEGVYLAVQGASELAFAILLGVENQMTEDRAIGFLKDLLPILHSQKIVLWGVLIIVLIDAAAAFTHNGYLLTIKTYGYYILGIAYLLTWLWMGIKMYKLHKSMGNAVILSMFIIVLSLVIKYTTGNTFIAIIGILTGISILAQIGPIYEYFIRKYTSAIMFNVYVDHTSIVMLFTLIIMVVYDKQAASIMLSSFPFFIISLGVIIKLFVVGFMLNSTVDLINNIEFAFRPPEEGGYQKVGVK